VQQARHDTSLGTKSPGLDGSQVGDGEVGNGDLDDLLTAATVGGLGSAVRRRGGVVGGCRGVVGGCRGVVRRCRGVIGGDSVATGGCTVSRPSTCRVRGTIIFQHFMCIRNVFIRYALYMHDDFLVFRFLLILIMMFRKLLYFALMMMIIR
jgi:hypothetical protein